MRHDPAAGAIVIMLRSLKMYGMAQAVTDLIEQGAPAFEAAIPILSQLLKAELAEREEALKPQAAVAFDGDVEQPPAPSERYLHKQAPVTVRLLFPFEHDGRIVRSIGLRPPRFDHVQAMIKGNIERTAMIAEMASVPVAVIEALRWPDAERVIGIAMDMAPDFANDNSRP